MKACPEQRRRIAIYARVSTSDKDQNTETQLLPLRDFCTAQGWEIFDEFQDYAPAADLGKRVAWRMMLDQAAIKEFEARRAELEKAAAEKLAAAQKLGEAITEALAAVLHRQPPGRMSGMTSTRLKAGNVTPSNQCLKGPAPA